MMIRRQLLPAIDDSAGLKSVGSALAPAVPEKVARVRSLEGSGRGKTVVVVGAGAAGLCAAGELQAFGYEVEVLEADPHHIGGRIRTRRLASGYGEFGAMRIPTVHDLTRFYVDECGLELRPFVQRNENAFFHIRDRRVTVGEAEALKEAFDLTAEEAQAGDLKLWETVVSTLAAALTEEERQDILSAEPRTSKILGLDRESLYSRFRAGGLSAEAIQFLASLWSLETSLHIGFLEHLREELVGVWAKDFDEIVGGMSRLPEALAAKLGKPVRSGSPVTAISRDEAGVEAVLADGSTIRGDWLICTVPLGAMKAIEFSPALSPRKQDAVRRVNYDSATKVLAIAKRRFWETDDGIYGGGSVSDGPLGSTWYPSDNVGRDPEVSAKPAVFLASYTWGLMARRMAEGTTREEIVRELSRFHYSLQKEPDLIESIETWSWDDHPWSEGAYAFALPGEQTELQAAAAAPEGRLIMAGEHTSLTHSWIQGALESALTASEAVVRADGGTGPGEARP
ncbi:MAG TPA: NAD(P)/FAD-dependent oxidoreductase [Allosphingosinicella sp.]|jgi:monoamine oxidase